MNQLLILKSGSDYLRFTAGGFELCPLNKASVFPQCQAEEAKRRCREVAEIGLAVALMQLTIIEEPYTE
jgi:hypothetical protein